MNEHCQKGVKPELIMQMKMDPDAKCEKFWALTLRQYLVVCGGHKRLAGEVMYQEKGRCTVCVFNRALRSIGLP